MNDRNIENLSLKDLEEVDALCEAYSLAWHSGTSPRIEDSIESIASHLRLVLAIELVELDMELRRSDGETPTIESYCERFPQWAATLEARLDPTPRKEQPSNTNSRIPGYEILGELGRGGMGIVYQARQLGLDRIVALKMAILGSDDGRNELDRFRIEAESIARLQHPNIVQIFDIGEANGAPYFTMEFVEGGNLAQSLAANPLSPIDAARLLEQLARAVAYAHEAGIVHRDLKPSNILLQMGRSSAEQSTKTFGRMSTKAQSVRSEGGRPALEPPVLNATRQRAVDHEPLAGASCYRAEQRISDHRSLDASESRWVPKLTDFGLAKQLDTDHSQTMSGMILGTPNYMAPEQTVGSSNKVGPAADIYSLGAILYEILVGRPPFRGASLLETLEQVRTLEPVSPRLLQPRISRDLDTICIKCLQKDPSQRYESAMKLAEDLARFADSLPIKARPIGVFERSGRWAKRKPMLAGLLAVVAILFGAVIVVPSILAIRLDRALKESDSNAKQAIDNQRMAELQAEKAEKAKAEAEAMAQTSQSHLVGLRIATGVNHAINGQHRQSLLWYHQAWKDDTFASRDERLHRLRVGFGLSQLPELVGLCVHDKPVLDIEFNPTGDRVLLRDESSRAFLWNPFIGERIGELEHGERIARAVFSPDGAIVATCGGKSLKLWNAATRACVNRFTFESDILWCDWNVDGSYLAIGCREGKVIVWDVDGATQYRETLHCGDDVIYTRFSPDGKFFIAVDAANKLSAWRLDDGGLLAKDISHSIWKKTEMAGFPQFVERGRYLLTHSDGKISCWDTSNWSEVIGRTEFKLLRDIAANVTGDRLVTATGSSVSNLFLLNDGLSKSVSTLTPIQLHNPRNTDRCAVSADGKLVATSSSSGVIEIWNGDDGARLDSVRMQGLPNQLRFRLGQNGENQLVAAGGDGTVRVWRMVTRGLRSEPYDFACGSAHNADWTMRDDYRYRTSPEGELEFRASNERGAFHDRVTGDSLAADIQLSQPIVHAIFSADSRRLVVADGKSCGVYDVRDGKRFGDLYTDENPIVRLSLSNDGRRLLILRAENACRIFDTDSGQPILGNEADSLKRDSGYDPMNFVGSQGRGDIEDIAISPTGEFILQRIAKDAVTRVFLASDGRMLFETDFQMGVAASISFSQDGRRFIVANSDTRARVWDLESRAPAGPFLHHPTYCRFGKLNSDGTLAVTFAADKQLRIWDTIKGDLLVSTEVDLLRHKIWFNKDSTRLIDRKPNGEISQWLLPLVRNSRDQVQSLLELHCGEEIDQTGGVAELESQRFWDGATRHLESWKATIK